MYVLGINGSPRVGGNTDILLDKVLEGAASVGAETEKVILNKLKFSPCQECNNVPDDTNCILKDDMQPLYKKIDRADAIILASPIFFGSTSAQTKMMIDRFQCIWRAKYMRGGGVFHRPLIPRTLSVAKGTRDLVRSKKTKIGVFVCVEASKRKDFFKNAKSIVKNFFATIDADYKNELFCMAVDRKLSILKNPDTLKEAFKLGKRIASFKGK